MNDLYINGTLIESMLAGKVSWDKTGWKPEEIYFDGYSAITFIKEIAALASAKKHRASAKLILKFINSRIEHEDFTAINHILEKLDLTTISTYEMVSLLITTRPCALDLPTRTGFRENVRIALVNDVGEKETEDTIKHL